MIGQHEDPYHQVDRSEVFDEQTSYMHELERDLREAVELQVELEVKGPLWEFIVWRWENAAVAIRELVKADPNDAAEIARLQSIVNEWKAGLQFLNTYFSKGDEARRNLEDPTNETEIDDGQEEIDEG